MIGVFRLESQMLSGSGKFERTGLGSDRDCKESMNRKQIETALAEISALHLKTTSSIIRICKVLA